MTPSLQNDQEIAFVDNVTYCYSKFADNSSAFGQYWNLHLHGFKYQEGVAGYNMVSNPGL